MIKYLLPILAVLIGGLSIFIWKPKGISSIKLLLAFSGAFLLSITVLEMLPNVYELKGRTISFWVLGGMIFQLLLEHISKGAEHGHIHVGHKFGMPWAIWISLCLHSFIEGIPMENHEHMSIAVFFHKLPIAMLIGFFLLQTKRPKIEIFFLFFIFGISTPLGSYLSSTHPIFSEIYIEFSALVAGMFMHVSTTILYESAEAHRFNLVKTIVILIGILMATITIL